MTASVVVKEVRVTSIKQGVYAGRVVFVAESRKIQFEYYHEFTQVGAVEHAIADGVRLLKRELEQFSSDAEAMLRFS